MPPFGDITGKGLLDARALWAAIVGPQRLAMGAKQSFNLTTGQATKIGDNIGAADAYVFLGVTLAGIGTVGLPTFVIFSKDDTIGEGSGIPHMFGLFGASPPPPLFTQLLLPGEQLFAQILLDPTGVGVATGRIVVSQVTF